MKKITKHDFYSLVHDVMLDNVTSTCSNIRSKSNILISSTSQKLALVKIERKRYWFNALDNVALNHPLIKIITTYRKTNLKKSAA